MGSRSMAVHVPSHVSGASNGFTLLGSPGHTAPLALVWLESRQMPFDAEHVQGAQTTVAGGVSAYPGYLYEVVVGQLGIVLPSGPSHTRYPGFHPLGTFTHWPVHVPWLASAQRGAVSASGPMILHTRR